MIPRMKATCDKCHEKKAVSHYRWNAEEWRLCDACVAKIRRTTGHKPRRY